MPPSLLVTAKADDHGRWSAQSRCRARPFGVTKPARASIMPPAIPPFKNVRSGPVPLTPLTSHGVLVPVAKREFAPAAAGTGPVGVALGVLSLDPKHHIGRRPSALKSAPSSPSAVACG